MRKIIGILIMGLMVIGLVGCGHKYTDTEKNVIADMESIIKNLEEGQKFLEDGGTKFGTYSNEIRSTLTKIGDDTKIGSMLVTETDKITESDEIYYEWVAYSDTADATLGLSNDSKVWAERTKIMKEILKQYKKNINTRD